MPIRLFTSGTHNKLKFSNDAVKNIYQNTHNADLEQIPFVLGHPKNDLPIVGWINKSFIKLYEEGKKQSIGFERSDADFSESSISAVKDSKQDKISVRIKNGAITHIGLVENAAVEENNYQEFTNQGEYCFNTDSILNFEDSNSTKNIVTAIIEGVKSAFTSNPNPKPKEENMDKTAAELQAENEALKTKMAEQAAEQKKNLNKAKVDSFKAEFCKKEYEGKFDQNAINRVAEALAQDESTFEFSKEDGTKVQTTALMDFTAILQSAATKATVKNGSVTAQFSKAEGGEEMTAEEYARAQYEN